MLEQRVNLYSFFKKEEKIEGPLSFKRYWQINVVIFSIFLLMYFFSLFSVHQLENEKKDTWQEVSNKKNKFEILKNKFPPQFFTEDIHTSMTKLDKELKEQTELVETLKNPIKFSEYLHVFSELITPNTWLKKIIISQNQIDLSGYALSLESIEKFLQNLLAEKLFSSFVLSVKNIETPKKDVASKNLNFQITLTKKQNNDELS